MGCLSLSKGTIITLQTLNPKTKSWIGTMGQKGFSLHFEETGALLCLDMHFMPRRKPSAFAPRCGDFRKSRAFFVECPF